MKVESSSYSHKEIEIIDKLTEVNRVLKKNGVSTDVDSTDLLSEVTALRIYNKITNSNKVLSDLKDRYIMVLWFKELGYKDPLAMAIKCWNDPNEMRNYQPSPGSAILSMFLSRSEVDLHRITARPGSDEIVESTLDCYKQQMPWVDARLIHMQKGKKISSQYKYETVPKYSKYHFDDAQEETEILASMGIICILFPQPWNEGYVSKQDNLLTINRAQSKGLANLGVNSSDFKSQPKMVQAYFVLADHILGR
ncbi:MAG: hypothetical protein UT39_C0001G0035 [Candidatus Woesebacteria bacterium GW2011_GWA1_39_21]|uniref:Uncharacterized protein n=1 Tax=Candidatus Woesebacteria bacterium GW2011_GWA1_39_21 TaxID=1618550 RepID=A0A0G0QNL7_9BACT|nr:MAG: hypothetical protein UT39_C0001G0035 [Candidatus Woesebacteria bacterium GW2011_GWA1_39_21]